MKVKKDFVLCEIADDFLVVPCGETAPEFHGMIRLNETGKAIWNALQEDVELPALAQLLVEKFGAPAEAAEADAAEFVENLRKIGCLE